MAVDVSCLNIVWEQEQYICGFTRPLGLSPEMDEFSSARCFFGWVEVGDEGEGCRSGGWEESHGNKHCSVYSAERLLGYLRSVVGFAGL